MNLQELMTLKSPMKLKRINLVKRKKLDPICNWGMGSRPMFSSYGRSLETSSITFVSKESIKSGSLDSLKLAKNTVAVEKTRDISKKDMVYNNYCPDISVDPETYEVTADGEILTCEPATELPMAQRYFLFQRK